MFLEIEDNKMKMEENGTWSSASTLLRIEDLIEKTFRR